MKGQFLKKTCSLTRFGGWDFCLYLFEINVVLEIKNCWFKTCLVPDLGNQCALILNSSSGDDHNFQQISFSCTQLLVRLITVKSFGIPALTVRGSSYKCLMALWPRRRVFFCLTTLQFDPVSPLHPLLSLVLFQKQRAPISQTAAASAAMSASCFPSSHCRCGSPSCLQGSSVSAWPLLTWRYF